MAVRAAVAGASGYAGGEVLRLLLAHPEVEIGALTGNSNAGQRLGALQPHLLPLADRVLAETTPEALAGHDVVFLALPHGQSAAVAEQFGPDVLVIDMGADFRLRDPADWGDLLRLPRTPAPGPTASPNYRTPAPGSRESKRIAVPGCYPTAVSLALFPASRGPPRRTRGGDRRRLRHLRRGQGAQAAPARQRGDGLHVASYGVGGGHRHTPR